MKKMTKTMIAVITILALTLTTSAAFATEGAQVKAQADKYTVKSTGDLNAGTLNYAPTKKPEARILYCEGKGVYECYSIGVKTKGKLYVDVEAHSGNGGTINVVVGSFNSSTGTINWYKGTEASISPGSTKTAVGGYDVNPGKKYWIGLKSSSEGMLAVSPYVIPYNTRLLKAGKMMIASGTKGGSNKDAAVQFKIRPNKSGYITVKLKELGYDNSTGYVQLLSKKKKAVSEKLWFAEGSKTGYVMFGVKKGVTYYLKVTGCQGTAENARAYVVKYSISKSPVRKNISKRKAVKLKRKGAWKKTVLLANGKAGKQWYKFRVTKKRKTVVKVDTRRVKSGTVKLTLYCGKKKIGSTTVSNGYNHVYTVTHSSTWGKANRGTYYIKISKSKKATGQYRIKYSR